MEGSVEENELKLTYQGPGVEDGSMDLTDLVSSLAGFHRVYRAVHKLANGKDCKSRITVKSFSHGSYTTTIQTMASHGDLLLPIPMSVLAVIDIILRVKSCAKHKTVSIKRIKTRELDVVYDETTTVHVEITQAIPPQDAEVIAYMLNTLLADEQVKSGMYDIVNPLEQNKIDSFDFTYKEGNGVAHTTIVTSDSKLNFEWMREDWPSKVNRDLIIEEIRSINKKSKKGVLVCQGKIMQYKFCIENEDDYIWSIAYRGRMKIQCSIVYNEDDIEKINIIEIHRIRRIR